MRVCNVDLLNTNNVQFKSCFVPLSQQNKGQKIVDTVLTHFNKEILPFCKNQPKIDANFFIPAAGAGSRFKIAHTIGDYNKINIPLPTGKNLFYAIDFVMMLSLPFIDNKCVQPLLSNKPNGSFGGVIDYYMSGNPIKDTVICSGDSVFCGITDKLTDDLLKAVQDSTSHCAVLGAQRTPKEVDSRYGIVVVNKNGIIKDFIEKPSYENACQYAIGGKNIVNTGCCYFSKDVMGHLIDELKSGSNPIKKNDVEIYDFGKSIEYVCSKTKDWFPEYIQTNPKIIMTNTWHDVGETEGFYKFLLALKTNNIFNQLSVENAKELQNEINLRVNQEQKSIDFCSDKSKPIKNCNIDGINILY
ncbi:MAG: hypothetical protein MJ237_06930 [bacterium]|nr:hypothetical protein [bacterium]